MIATCPQRLLLIIMIKHDKSYTKHAIANHIIILKSHKPIIWLSITYTQNIKENMCWQHLYTKMSRMHSCHTLSDYTMNGRAFAQHSGKKKRQQRQEAQHGGTIGCSYLSSWAASFIWSFSTCTNQSHTHCFWLNFLTYLW